MATTRSRPSGEYFISRTGYTGEDGFEIFVPTAKAVEIWDRFIEANVDPIGLGARDTLRTEAAMPLYGNDIDDTNDAARGRPRLRDRAGEARVHRPGGAEGRPAGPRGASAGLVLESKRIARQGYEIFHDGQEGGRGDERHVEPGAGEVDRDGLPAGGACARRGTSVEIDIRGRARSVGRQAPLLSPQKNLTGFWTVII
jgi:aminomethyltransferase